METASIPIKFTDRTQESVALQKVASDVAKILTPNEEILYVALQNASALSMKKDSAVATNNRIILYRPGMLGRVNFEDFQWQDVADVKLNQGFLASDLTVTLATGARSVLGGLDKEQAKRLYGIAQQMEQEWREKRRIRDMEEARAKAGGYQFAPGMMPGMMAAPPAAPAAPAEDPVQKLGKAKAMLDQGLISEAEYDTLKAKILSAM